MHHRRLAGALAALAVFAATSCSTGAPAGAGQPVLVYVLSAHDGTIARLDAATGREFGPRLPAGAAPGSLAVAGDAVLVQPAAWRDAGHLTRVVRTGGAWTAEPVEVDPAGRALALAGDGERYAVLAYTPRAGASRCRLALVDGRTGTVERTPPVCTAGEAVLGLALATTTAGPTAFLALWRPPEAADSGHGDDPGGGRVLAVAAATGDVLAVHALAGTPGGGVVAAGPAGSDVRLYVVEGIGGEQSDPASGPDVTAADRWRVLALSAPTLEVERAYPVPAPPSALAVAPDGRHAYAFAGPGHSGLASTVVALDLATGAWRDLARVPGSGAGGLAVTGGRVYIPNLEGDRVTAIDRHAGVRLGAIDAGRAPAAISAGVWTP